MFQSFQDTSQAQYTSERIRSLRKEIAHYKLDGFLVTNASEYQGGYVLPYSQRLSWLTGFTGSAGLALVLQECAVLFIDGRYITQARQQTDQNIFFYHDFIGISSLITWLKNYEKTEIKIALDPWVHTIEDVRKIRKLLDNQGGYLETKVPNLIDKIWHSRPNSPLGYIFIQPVYLTGKTAEEKILQVRTAITEKGANATIITDPASIAWCFNIRGTDVPHTPIPLSFAILPVQEKTMLFIDKRKLGKKERNYLSSFCVLKEPSQFQTELMNLSPNTLPILIDPTSIAHQIYQKIINKYTKDSVFFCNDPIQLMRALKTSVEVIGAKKAHERDGVALTRFFSWLSRQPIGSQDEISTAKKLEELRSTTALEFCSKLEDISFDTISGVGKNSAVIHYKVNTNTNRLLTNGELYLVDSGAQYCDGTTDVTRTIAIGSVGEEEKRCFTLVLKGMIAISMARFPPKTRGQDIDVLARIALWKNGFDYPHSTGHGVGSFLSVHEGPQCISSSGKHPLYPGMILSNEPGFYRKDAFGIRIENLLLVSSPQIPKGGNKLMLEFKTLTICPIDKTLIIPQLLNHEEKKWLNRYHRKVYDKLSPFLNSQDQAWLKTATTPLSKCMKLK